MKKGRTRWAAGNSEENNEINTEYMQTYVQVFSCSRMYFSICNFIVHACIFDILASVDTKRVLRKNRLLNNGVLRNLI
uniref:Uncharacterized protein n=1 Tax=Octopus bimaculoides TaxID=37653 RepID=A0A0L8FL71_OCTBM